MKNSYKLCLSGSSEKQMPRQDLTGQSLACETRGSEPVEAEGAVTPPRPIPVRERGKEGWAKSPNALWPDGSSTRPAEASSPSRCQESPVSQEWASLRVLASPSMAWQAGLDFCHSSWCSVSYSPAVRGLRVLLTEPPQI